ncbi:MAG: hypothetical protein ACJ8EH_02500 [Sphingomicrobium sp.]
MRSLLIGPALIGRGWIAGSYHGADAEQLVRKSAPQPHENVSHGPRKTGSNRLTAQ